MVLMRAVNGNGMSSADVKLRVLYSRECMGWLALRGRELCECLWWAESGWQRRNERSIVRIVRYLVLLQLQREAFGRSLWVEVQSCWGGLGHWCCGGVIPPYRGFVRVAVGVNVWGYWDLRPAVRLMRLLGSGRKD